MGGFIARGSRVRRAPGRPVPPGADPIYDCYFDFAISIPLMGGSRSVTLERGPDCMVMIGDIEDQNVIEADDPVVLQRNAPRNPLARLWDALMPTVHALFGPMKRTVYGHVYQYGLGGAALTDGLTAQQGWLTYRYYQGQVTQIPYETYGWTCTAGRDYYGQPNCKPPHLQIPPMFPLNLGWWAYNFYIGDQFYGPGSVIHRIDYSSYFFQNYNTLNHTFQNQRIAYGNGQATCLFAYTGSIVFGPTNSCTVSNPVPAP